jgi:hypothetical protein
VLNIPVYAAAGSGAPLFNPAGGQNNYAPLDSPNFTTRVITPEIDSSGNPLQIKDTMGVCFQTQNGTEEFCIDQYGQTYFQSTGANTTSLTVRNSPNNPSTPPSEPIFAVTGSPGLGYGEDYFTITPGGSSGPATINFPSVAALNLPTNTYYGGVGTSYIPCTPASGTCGSAGGNTNSSSLTTNTLPKANGANSIVNSSLSDNGTTVSTSEPIAMGYGSTVKNSGGTAQGICLGDGSTSTGIGTCGVGISSINGDTTAAQKIKAAGTLGVTTASGVTTVATDGSLSSYTGFVSNRAGPPLTADASTAVTWLMGSDFFDTRLAFNVGDTFQIIIANGYPGTNPGTATYKIALQYPFSSGTIYPSACLISGSQSVTLAGGAFGTYTCTMPVTLPFGSRVGYRLLQVNTAGVIYNQYASDQGLGTQYQGGTGTPNDVVNGGTITDGFGGGINVHPIAVVAQTTKDSWMLVHDSRGCGQQAYPNNGMTGEDAPSVGALYGYTNLCFPTRTATNIASTYLPYYSSLFSFATKVMDGAGINELLNISPPATATATAISGRAAIASLFTVPVYGATVMSASSSSDGWTTLANQNCVVGGSCVGNIADARPLDAVIRMDGTANGITGEFKPVDTAMALDPLDLAMWPITPTGAATTDDGIHANIAGINIITNSNTINMTALAAGKGLGSVIGGLPCTTAGVTGCLSTPTNCSSSASPAVCGSAAAGSFVIAAGSTSVTVNTTALSNLSQILITPDESLGTKLGVTCNTTMAAALAGFGVTARVAGTGFTITTLGTIAGNPACYSYLIVNQ